jgi:hypothetical protein
MASYIQFNESGKAHPGAANGIFVGGGDMGQLMRTFDWSATALGPAETWPQSLKTTVSTCLDSRFAILIWWGPELVMLYNDRYRTIIGDKHPHALGARAIEVWPEIWHIIAPMLEGVMRRGEATWSDNLLLELERNGYQEECYFTFSYSPIRDESGGVGGIFTPVQETTSQVIGERRLRTLRDLAEEPAPPTPKAAKRFAAWQVRRWPTTSMTFPSPLSTSFLRTVTRPIWPEVPVSQLKAL